MNQFKKDLQDELQAFSLSDERKQQIAGKIRKRKRKSLSRGQWSYRLAVTAFMIFSISFGFLLLQEKNTIQEITRTAEPSETVTFISILTSDWGKSMILIGLFIGIRVIVKRSLIHKGKDLPVCIKCGEEWPYREALKMSMKNEVVICPHCEKKQYKTRKSSRRAGMLTFLVPVGIVTAQIFDHIFLGYFIHVVGTIWLIITLTPYLIELQEDDPMLKPLY